MSTGICECCHADRPCPCCQLHYKITTLAEFFVRGQPKPRRAPQAMAFHSKEKKARAQPKAEGAAV